MTNAEGILLVEINKVIHVLSNTLNIKDVSISFEALEKKGNTLLIQFP